MCRRNRENMLQIKSNEEIIEMLYSEINLTAKEKVYISQNKTKLIYIYKNSYGSYSIGIEKITIFDEEERKYAKRYGIWEVDNSMKYASFYESIDDAINDINKEINDFIKLK